jgi:hypothetical protein
MNNKKVLSAAILLILAKSALAIEVESNNDSKLANKLGAENVGKLNKASDVDFFSVDSCVKDDKKQCRKYTAADEKLNPLNKAGTDVRREEVSLSFTCTNRSASTNTSTGLAPVTTTGWFLGIHDSNGELQETYPVSPADCIITDTALSGFNFRFPSLDSPNYYISVVSDCAAPPIYNTVTDPKDPTKTIVNVNKFVTAALTTQKEIDTTKAEIVAAQSAIDKANDDLSSASFAVINSNANIQKLSDALALVNDITIPASITLTPATNITAALSTAKAIGIAGFAMRYSIYTYGQVLIADAVAKNPAIAANIEAADAAITLAQIDIDKATLDAESATRAATNADSAVKLAGDLLTIWIDSTTPYGISQANKYKADKEAAETAKKTADAKSLAADTAKSLATRKKGEAENAKKAADNVKTKLDQALTDAKAKDTDAQTKLTEAMKAVDDAVTALNKTVNDNITAANTAQNFIKRFDSACKDTYNAGIYTLKDNPDNGIQRLDTISSMPQTNLGLESSGSIKTITDNNVYVVESDGTSEIPLVFTCSAMAARQTSDWKLSIFNDTNGLVSSTLINGSTCGSGFIGDKGGYSFKLPKGSQRYYLSVESACVSSAKTGCAVETAEYSILRDVEKVYAGKLASKLIDAKSAALKLTNCGLNNNAVISIKAENVDLADAAKLGAGKLPINVQIGSTACRILTPELSTKNAISGSVADSSEIVDSASMAKDSVKITLGNCGADNSKVTLVGSKLDLVNFNPNSALDEVMIPVKVNIGDFNCQTKEVFAITTNTAGSGTTYSNVPDDAAAIATAAATTAAVDPIVTTLSTAKNIGVSQQNSLKLATDVQAYYVDVGIKSVVDFEFSCPTSTRFANDWVLSIYDSTKKLVSKQPINGSDCGTGLVGDNGTYLFSLSKDSPRSYVVITSACDATDKTCEVDKSKYEIKRLLPVAATTTSAGTAAAAPCFHGVCDTVTETDFPVFGGK